jgi:hypothetical protein
MKLRVALLSVPLAIAVPLVAPAPATATDNSGKGKPASLNKARQKTQTTSDRSLASVNVDEGNLPRLVGHQLPTTDEWVTAVRGLGFHPVSGTDKWDAAVEQVRKRYAPGTIATVLARGDSQVQVWKLVVGRDFKVKWERKRGVVVKESNGDESRPDSAADMYIRFDLEPTHEVTVRSLRSGLVKTPTVMSADWIEEMSMLGFQPRNSPKSPVQKAHNGGEGTVITMVVATKPKWATHYLLRAFRITNLGNGTLRMIDKDTDAEITVLDAREGIFQDVDKYEGKDSSSKAFYHFDHRPGR